ncbi:MAG: hypothetical protein M1825_004701 [Sarcosagium campestre]|nr:MAG: hypothetical protein M1825_004701 [Sarcosagium campestre]
MADATKIEAAVRVTVLISGNGTNLQALIDACNTASLPSTTIVRVISNRRAAYGLIRAHAASIPTYYHALPPYKTAYPSSTAAARSAYDADLAKLILADTPDLVVCAGWMHVLAPSFLSALKDAAIPVINLHPALPGCFDGAKAIERAHAAFSAGEVQKTGVMVHYVVEEVDRGEVILQEEVEMRKGEPLHDLEQRIHEIERPLLVRGANIVLGLIRQRKSKGILPATVNSTS